MESTTTSPDGVSTAARWAGRIASGIPALFLAFDTAIHFAKPAPVVQAFAHLGLPLSLSVPLAGIELGCLIVYLIPRTSFLGAILLTGYLGGAVATHLRAGDPLFNVLFPVIVGILAWGGLFLRNKRVRVLIPVERAVS